ncbi:MAG: cytochrome c oxidase subunit II [Halobacteriales archaeon]|nr:cytochrome c oxidase subunit II [Halobacteriales archaeon]
MPRAANLACAISVLAFFALAGLAAAQGQPNGASDNGKLDPFGAPGSSIAASIQKLYDLILPISIVIGVLVEALLLYGIWRYRAKRAGRIEHSDEHERGHHKLEIAWTIPPALILLMVGLLSTGTLASIDGPANTPTFGDFEIKVIGHQWFWQFMYPDNSTNTDTLIVEAGKNVRLNVTSTDVIHDFAIPNLGVKIDAVPGRVNHYWFNADKVGDYQTQCMEYCGGSHAYMRGQLHVVGKGATQNGWKNPQNTIGQITNCADDKNATKVQQITLVDGGAAPPWSIQPPQVTLSAADMVCFAVSAQANNAAPHNFTIIDNKGAKVAAYEPTLDGGKQGAVPDLKLAPGTYVYYCAVPGHRQIGMQGTLTVS